jgi:GNAT superfamily N-acetyltransferase
MSIKLVNAQKDQFAVFNKMMKAWFHDYRKSGDCAPKQSTKEVMNNFKTLLNEKNVMFIEYDDKIVGFVTMLSFDDNLANGSKTFIELMFVERAYRGKGIAAKVRSMLLQKKRIIGTIVSYGRVEKNLGYFVKCGFTHITEYPRQVGSDKGLCFLTNESNCMTKPLNIFGLAQSRADANMKSMMCA